MRKFLSSLLLLVVTVFNLSAARLAAVKAPAEDNGLILDVEGEITRFVTHVYWVNEGSSFYDEGMLASICYAPDGTTVYFRDLIPRWCEGWIKGSADEDGTLHFPTGQLTSDWPVGRIYMGSAIIDPRSGQMKLTDEFRLIPQQGNAYLLDTENGDTVFIIAYMEDGGVLEIDYSLALSEFTEKEATPPADAVQRAYIRTYFDEVSKIPYQNVVLSYRDGNDIWLQGLSGFSDAWLKGNVTADGSVFIPTGQYIGQSGAYVQHAYSLKAESEGGQLYPTDGLTLLPDGDGLRCAEGELMSYGYNEAQIEYRHKRFLFEPYDMVAMVPAVPYNLYWGEVLENSYMPGHTPGEHFLTFSSDICTEDGTLLYPKNMYYEVAIDGELYTFMPEKYPSLKEPLCRVPHGFADNIDFNFMGVHTIFLKDLPEHTIGVRAVYTVDGTSMESVFGTLEIASDGVTAVISDAAPVRTEYRDLSGRLVQAPAAGIYIKSEFMSDGTIRNSKIIIQ